MSLLVRCCLLLLSGCVAAAPLPPAPRPSAPLPELTATPPAPTPLAPRLDCAVSVRCRTLGECTRSDGPQPECYVANDADCAGSEACTTHGKCIARGFAVAKTCGLPCRQDSQCAQSGLCADAYGGCVASSAQDCERSMECRDNGSCGLVGNACQPTSVRHCQRSMLCRTAGLCLFRAGHGCLSPRQLRCDCPPPGKASPEGLRAHAQCLAKGGGWGPLCGPAPP